MGFALKQIVRPFQFLASWLGGWSRLVLLIVAVAGVGFGWFWQQQQRPPLPPNVANVSASIVGEIRQTTFRYGGSVEEIRAFYKTVMPSRGWRYCGTQSIPDCSNMISLVDRPPDAMDVYRRASDEANQGSTIEVWPIAAENNQTFVTLYETRSK